MFAIRQERKEGKADFKKVMEHCSGCFKPIFRFLKLKFDIDIPPSIDMTSLNWRKSVALSWRKLLQSCNRHQTFASNFPTHLLWF